MNSSGTQSRYTTRTQLASGNNSRRQRLKYALGAFFNSLRARVEQNRERAQKKLTTNQCEGLNFIANSNSGNQLELSVRWGGVGNLFRYLVDVNGNNDL